MAYMLTLILMCLTFSVVRLHKWEFDSKLLKPESGKTNWLDPSNLLISNTLQSSFIATNINMLYNFGFKQGKIKMQQRLCLLYLFMVLLNDITDPHPNPGPQTKYPCGTCGKGVTYKDRGLMCDTCDTWFHASCQGCSDNIYAVLDSSNLSWHCIACGMPNFSSCLFNSTPV